MLIAISILILAYWIMGKDISKLLERVKSVNWRGKINDMIQMSPANRKLAMVEFAQEERLAEKVFKMY